MITCYPDPLHHDQKSEEITAYLRGLAPGDEVAIYSTYVGFRRYQIVRVTDINPARGRVYIEEHDAMAAGVAWYTKSGKNCYSPTGQAKLCIPTEKVREHAQKHPDGEMLPFKGFPSR